MTGLIKYINTFEPEAWQVAPWRDRSLIMLLTGSAGGGKSRIAGEKLHGFLLRYGGSTGLALRKTRESMTNSTLLFLEREIIGDHPQVQHFPAKHRFEYSNGSILAYGGMADKKQREQIRSVGQSGGIEIAWMEEANAFEESDFQELLPRLRGKAAPWRQLLLSTNPDSPLHWIKRRLIDGGEASVYYSRASDNSHNPADYQDTLGKLQGIEKQRLADGLWVMADGLVYDQWVDGPEDGNVTPAAEYVEGGGSLIWFVDDGYAAGSRPESFGIDPKTGTYVADSHPRVFLLAQERHDGTVAVFYEHYACLKLSDKHIKEVRELGYPEPDYAGVDKSAAELKGRLHEAGIYTRNGPPSVEESIKEVQRRLAKDENDKRLIVVHPRCHHLRQEMASHARNKATGHPIKTFDHGPDALRYGIWTLRFS